MIVDMGKEKVLKRKCRVSCLFSPSLESFFVRMSSLFSDEDSPSEYTGSRRLTKFKNREEDYDQAYVMLSPSPLTVVNLISNRIQTFYRSLFFCIKCKIVSMTFLDSCNSNQSIIRRW